MYYMKKSFRWSQLPSYPNREDFKFLTTFCLSKIFHYYIFYFVEKKNIFWVYQKIIPRNIWQENYTTEPPKSKFERLFFFALYKATKITPQK